MATEELEQRLEDMERIATTVNMFDSFELQLAAFSYLTRGSAPLPPTMLPAVEEDEPVEETVLEIETSGAASTVTGTKSPRKRSAKKAVMTLDKSLDLYPKDAPTFNDFAAEKAPGTHISKVVVTVYWLKEHGKVETISANHIYTCFKSSGWPLPADVPNTLAKAGQQNFLDSSKSDDIKLTTHGENYVEHKLPAPTKA